MAEHTPGPWSEGDGRHGRWDYMVYGHDGKIVADCHHGIRKDDGTIVSNVALIAAAPDLLAALETIVKYTTWDAFGDMHLRALAAIAKARGEA